MLWSGTAAVPGVQSGWVGQKIRPRASGEKRVEDVLPSWRSMRSLAAKKLPLDYGAGVSPEMAKPQSDPVPRGRACQG